MDHAHAQPNSALARQLYLQPKTAAATHSPKNVRKIQQTLPPIENSVGVQKAAQMRTNLKSLIAPKASYRGDRCMLCCA